MQSPYGPAPSRVSTYRPNPQRQMVRPLPPGPGFGGQLVGQRKIPRPTPTHYIPPTAARPGVQPGPQGAGAVRPPRVDYSGDPILQQIIAGQDASLARGRAGLLDTQKQLLLRLGSQQLASKVLGNDPFVQTVGQDPFSMLGLINRQYDQNRSAMDEDLNQANLFYSGARVKGQQDLAYERLRSENEAVTGTQDALTAAMSQFQGLQEQLYADRQQAEQEAYNRALELALAYGYTGEQPGSGAPASQPAAAGAMAGAMPSVMTDAKINQLRKLMG